MSENCGSVCVLHCVRPRHVLGATAALLCLISTVMAVAGWFVVERVGAQLGDTAKLATYLQLVVSMFVIFCAALAIAACLSPKSGMAKLVATMVTCQLVFSLGSGILCLYCIFRQWQTDTCLGILATNGWKSLCQRPGLMGGIVLGFIKVSWVLEIAVIYFAHAHAHELEEEEIFDCLDSPKRGLQDRPPHQVIDYGEDYSSAPETSSSIFIAFILSVLIFSIWTNVTMIQSDMCSASGSISRDDFSLPKKR